MVVAAAEIKVSKLELKFGLPQNVLKFTHCQSPSFFFLEHDSQVVNKIGSSLLSLTSSQQVYGKKFWLIWLKKSGLSVNWFEQFIGSISDMIANNPYFRPSIGMCYRMSFTQ